MVKIFPKRRLKSHTKTGRIKSASGSELGKNRLHTLPTYLPKYVETDNKASLMK